MGCANNSCERAHEHYRNPYRLTSSIWLVIAKGGGLKKRPKIEAGQGSDRIRDIRQKAKSEKREKMDRPSQTYVPAGQRAAGAADPMCYPELDFVDQENPLRNAIGGPDHAWAEILPQHEAGAVNPSPFSSTASCDGGGILRNPTPSRKDADAR